MGCNCGKIKTPTYSNNRQLVANGNNQDLINQIQEQQRQQAVQQQTISQIISKSSNPSKILIKTYR